MTDVGVALTGGFWPVVDSVPEPLSGDCDGDFDIDVVDSAYVSDCLSGPVVWPGDDCVCADIDDDGDADLADLARF